MTPEQKRVYEFLGDTEWTDRHGVPTKLRDLTTLHVNSIVAMLATRKLNHIPDGRRKDLVEYGDLRRLWDRENRWPSSGKLKGTGTATGRLTAEEKATLGRPVGSVAHQRSLRDSFVERYSGGSAKMGDQPKTLTEADYSALEERILAWLGSDMFEALGAAAEDGAVSDAAISRLMMDKLAADTKIEIVPSPSGVSGELSFLVKVRPASLPDLDLGETEDDVLS